MQWQATEGEVTAQGEILSILAPYKMSTRDFPKGSVSVRLRTNPNVDDTGSQGIKPRQVELKIKGFQDIERGTGGADTLLFNHLFQSDVWYFVAITLDMTTDAVARLYVNGQPEPDATELLSSALGRPQASAPSHSSSPVSLPKKRNSSPMEEHLKQVVKTSVVDFCSEVQEENIYLSEKVEKLEKHVEKFSMLEKELAETKMQLARTTSQLNDCATRQQMSDLLSQHAATQELLREQIALRDQGQASCRGCTIC